jgi:hypothetical protein
LHTTNETIKAENKGTRGLKEWNGWGGGGGTRGPHLPARLVTGYGATTRREVMDLSVSRPLYFPLFLLLKKHLAGKRDADVGQAVSSWKDTSHRFFLRRYTNLATKVRSLRQWRQSGGLMCTMRHVAIQLSSRHQSVLWPV